MDTKKSKTKAKDKNQDNINPEAVIDHDELPEEDLWEEEDEDFGGLQAPDDFKRQLGCGG